MPKNLILAYAVTWVIHLAYVGHLARKARALRPDTPVPPVSTAGTNR